MVLHVAEERHDLLEAEALDQGLQLRPMVAVPMTRRVASGTRARTLAIASMHLCTPCFSRSEPMCTTRCGSAGDPWGSRRRPSGRGAVGRGDPVACVRRPSGGDVPGLVTAARADRVDPVVRAVDDRIRESVGHVVDRPERDALDLAEPPCDQPRQRIQRVDADELVDLAGQPQGPPDREHEVLRPGDGLRHASIPRDARHEPRSRGSRRDGSTRPWPRSGKHARS